MYSFVVLLD